MMNKIHWYHRIRIQVMAILVILVIIPIIIFWNYNQWNTTQNLLQNYSDSAVNELYGTSLIMENIMENIRDYSRSISEDQAFLDRIQAYQQNLRREENSEINRAGLSLTMGQYVSENALLSSMYLYFTDSHILVTMLPDQKIFTEDDDYCRFFRDFYYNQMDSSLVWRILDTPEESDTTLSLIRLIPSSYTRNSCLLICNLKNSAWKGHLKTIVPEGGSALITDYSGYIFFEFHDPDSGQHSAEDPVFEQARQSMKTSGTYSDEDQTSACRVVYYNSVDNGWRYITCKAESRILKRNITSNVWFYLLILLVALMCILLGNMILNYTILAPIQTMISYMEKTETGLLEEATGAFPSNELSLLFGSYNHMIHRLRELIDQVYIQQLQREKTQLNYLQSQMDEHFLFNTLNTIYSESCHENAPATGRMVLTLSRYFRRSLSYGQEKMPLNEIAELLALYLQLQRMRYGQNLQCRIDAFPEMDQYIALKYLFQPLVENAIVHGFEKNPDGHQIHIVFRREENDLCFEVEDDGAGIPEDRLHLLREQINDRHAVDSDQGFALRNVHEQICLTYGEHPIHIESQYGCGTRVFFRIPLEKNTAI